MTMTLHQAIKACKMTSTEVIALANEYDATHGGGVSLDGLHADGTVPSEDIEALRAWIGEVKGADVLVNFDERLKYPL